MEKLKQFMEAYGIAWNWDVSKRERLFAWIPHSKMEHFTVLLEVECALSDLGTVEADFSVNALGVDLCLFYDVSQLREAFPQSYFQNKSKGELLMLMDDYDEYLSAFKQLQKPEQAPMALREFYEHGCPRLNLPNKPSDQAPDWDGPGLGM